MNKPTLTLLHGDHQFLSRQALSKLIDASKRSGSTQVTILPYQSLTPNQVTLSLESSSLFGQSKHIILENIFKLKSTSTLSHILEIIHRNRDKLPITVWTDSLLPASKVKKLAPDTIQTFKLPKNIFAFLDTLYPGNQKQAIIQFQSIKTEPITLVIYMVFRQIRLLIQASVADSKLPAWQLNKLKMQVRKWPLPQLLTFHQHLLDLEADLKSGGEFPAQKLETLINQTLSI